MFRIMLTSHCRHTNKFQQNFNAVTTSWAHWDWFMNINFNQVFNAHSTANYQWSMVPAIAMDSLLLGKFSFLHV